MSQRYYLEQPPHDGQACLAGAEAHHLAHVMRARVGDEVTLFDGDGNEYQARIERMGKHEVMLAVLSRTAVDRELGVSVTLGVALPRGDRQSWLVEKGVELGVQCLVPLETSRGVAQPTDNALQRLRRNVIEASKQCGRNRLMQIAEPRSWNEFLTEHDSRWARLVAHPHAPPLDAEFWQSTSLQGFVLAVGPEGGLTDDEVAGAHAAGWRVASLGKRILRIETAALLLAAWACRGGGEVSR